ncbi:MAG: hypothetical protein IPJ84_18420 [Bdellovibrionales bacterium]|nr:hypothetical protein [Bdellovibrionales bacterium]
MNVILVLALVGLTYAINSNAQSRSTSLTGSDSTTAVLADERAKAEIAHEKGKKAVELIRKNLCHECPTFLERPRFYVFTGGNSDEVDEIRILIEKTSPQKTAGILFNIPVTIVLKDGLPEKISIYDDGSPRIARQSSIGLISAREIPVTPDGKIAKLKYPKRLFEMFEDKSSYSIAQFFWDSEDGQIGPTDFRTEKRVTVCGVTLEKGETIHYEWSDGYWGGPFKKPFKFKGRVLDPTEYILSFFYKDGCRVRIDNSKTGELIIN